MAESVVQSAGGDQSARPLETEGPHIGTMDRVAALLRGESSPAEPVLETEPVEDATPAPEPASESWDVKAVAERLQTDPAALYQQLAVTLEDGTELKLGELKDLWQTHQRGLKQYQSERGNFEADRIRYQRERDELLAAIDPQSIRPELRDAWQRQEKDRVSRELESLLRAVPEWSEQTTAQREVAQIQDYLAGYKFSPAEVAAISDHRMMLVLRDAAKLAAAAKKAPEPAKPRTGMKPGRTAPQTAASETARIKAQVAGKKMPVTRGVDELLKLHGVR